MHFTDTHTHLYLPEFNTDRDSLLKKAIGLGIKRFYLPNIDSGSIDPMLELEKNYPDMCFAMMGLHPCSVNHNYEKELETVKKWLEKRPFAAIGEIGIDLYWDKTFFEQQKLAFRAQVQWALDYDYPIIIHCREAFEPIYEELKAFSRLPRGIFHCFSGSAEQANKIIELGGFKLGIGGVLTYKNSGLDKAILEIPLQHLLLETDAPYLSPVPFRGKRNEPAYMMEVARKLAEIKNVTLAEVSEHTEAAANFIFNKP